MSDAASVPKDRLPRPPSDGHPGQRLERDNDGAPRSRPWRAQSKPRRHADWLPLPHGVRGVAGGAETTLKSAPKRSHRLEAHSAILESAHRSTPYGVPRCTSPRATIDPQSADRRAPCLLSLWLR